MRVGLVKFYNESKSYGFIRDEVTGAEYFVHLSGLSQGLTTLLEGAQVQFDIEPGKKGETAVNVRLVM